MIKIKNFAFNELGVNCFVLYDETSECVIIDPGCNTVRQEEQLTGFIDSKHLKPVAILLTHGHFDHIFGITAIKAVYSCDLVMHKSDEILVENASQYAGIFGFTVGKTPKADRFIDENDTVHFGNSSLEIIHVPGHSPGSICFYSGSDHFAICGDVLFNGSVGRTDLPGGNHELLIKGIRDKLMILPRETIVWPGHGPHTTIGREHDTNPFLN
jgi:glyoxylase-like metal-dependent hydrolase (beta-lactamase superfamily II)